MSKNKFHKQLKQLTVSHRMSNFGSIQCKSKTKFTDNNSYSNNLTV